MEEAEEAEEAEAEEAEEAEEAAEEAEEEMEMALFEQLRQSSAALATVTGSEVARLEPGDKAGELLESPPKDQEIDAPSAKHTGQRLSRNFVES